MPVTRQCENDAMTQKSIQAMIDQAIQRNSTHTQDNASQNLGGGPKRPVQPMESVFHINGYTVDNQVKFATCTLLWTLKKKLTDKYCPKCEIKKLEIELWNLKVRRNDVAAYTQRFQELALMCTKFLADETEKVDKYINGLPDNIHGNVMSARPKTLDEVIELDNDLMDQKLRTYAERQIESKRKFDNNNQAQQIPKRQNVAQAYAIRTGERKEASGLSTLFQCSGMPDRASDKASNMSTLFQCSGVPDRASTMSTLFQHSGVPDRALGMSTLIQCSDVPDRASSMSTLIQCSGVPGRAS
nr:hypothetical protein [Tanacetum cinerariifolium]